jgi:hypothetical protein
MTVLSEHGEAGRSMNDCMDDGAGPVAVLAKPLVEPAGFLQPDDRPTLLIVADNGRAEVIARWAERAGLRCVGSVALESASERLARTALLDLVLLDLRGVDVAARISRATAQALTGRYGLPDARLAVITDLAGLDCALAMLESPETEFLCEPPESDIVTLLVMAGLHQGRSSRMPLHDAARDSETARLEQLSEEVRRLAVTIERMTLNGAAPHATNGAANGAMSHGVTLNGAVKETRGAYRAGIVETAPDPAQQFQQRVRPIMVETDHSARPSHAEVRALIRARRMRDQYLPADLFADPAWDMMLDLLAAQLAGQRVSVSSLCIAAAVPPTTALRWIRQLSDRAIFARIDDPADGRRVFIELTEAATQAVLSWANAIRRNGGLLVKAQR